MDVPRRPDVVAVDPEGEAVSVGVDHDRDGVVDVQLPRAEGRIANETTGMLAIPWNGSIVVERVAEYGEGCHLSFTRFFDVIATDASGNAATYTVQTGAIESNSFYRNLMDAEDVDDGNANLYFGNYVTQADVDWVTRGRDRFAVHPSEQQRWWRVHDQRV